MAPSHVKEGDGVAGYVSDNTRGLATQQCTEYRMCVHYLDVCWRDTETRLYKQGRSGALRSSIFCDLGSRV